jgi:hypothetical protein
MTSWPVAPLTWRLGRKVAPMFVPLSCSYQFMTEVLSFFQIW